MSWPEHPAGAEEEEVDLASSGPAGEGEGPVLYPGDTGRLPLDARRVLCSLLAGPSLDAQRHGQLWPVLLRHEAAVRSHLAELFLELVIDREMGLAFTRQADTGELETPILLRTSPLTFIDSVLLLHLRQQLAEAEAQGRRAVVEEGVLVEVLSIYEKQLSTDRAGFNKRVAASITKMRENNVLQKLRGSEDRMEVTPALKLLFPAEDVRALSDVYRGMREDDPPGDHGAAAEQGDD